MSDSDKVPKNSDLIFDEGEEIVISGIAGRFPSCDNVNILRDKLMNKEDLISDECRWGKSHPEIPPRMGKINNLQKFDATFFGVHSKQVHSMDPMSRVLMEHAFEAILDAGINPNTLRGKDVAVIVGSCFSETEKIWFYERMEVNGFGITGCSRAMMANRISYYFDFHGPSYVMDTACSSSLFALEQAYRFMREGKCEAAIVAGANLCLHPHLTLQFKRLGVLSMDGKCKTFDKEANGYVRSETIGAVLLQKAKDAKRIYSTVVHAKTNCDGYKEQGITYPSSNIQMRLLQDFYKECQISPRIVSYVECHGTGTAVGDPEELQAVNQIFCADRTTPLMIGSIKSNLGHSEPASGLCGIAKIIIAMETGIIPPNLHLKNPQDILKEVRMTPIVEPTPWKVDYAALNSFGFGGANAHVLLKPWLKEKGKNGVSHDDLPRLVIVSGRTEEAVEVLLQESQNHGLDMEYIGLLHNIYSIDIPAHLYRGYTIVGSKVSNTCTKEIEQCVRAHKPLWYCFSGMGSQWIGMGEALLRFPIFAKAVQKCDAVLRPRGINIYNILTTKDETIFNNVLNSFVGIAAIQIGLIDLLTAVGVVPDNLIGHSVGELGCAYADGSLTAEQTVLAAYCRGLATNESDLIVGAMAAVGLAYKELKNMCPSDIDVACHNSSTSSTISGPAKSVKKFVAELQKNKIFAREVASSNVAYHSRYIASAGPKLLAQLKKVIPSPKPRSDKWMSTSLPKEKWSTPEAKLCSAEYLTNNLLSSVLFEETAELIPKNAIVIEIAPHGLLQAILKRSLESTVTNIPLTLRGHSDNAEFFVQALGKLYNAGVQIQIANIYPSVQFPVSRGTPMISPHIRWEHSEDWFLANYNQVNDICSAERILDIYSDEDQFAYMVDHIIDRRSLIPATSYLFFVWETYAMSLGVPYDALSVIFENVRFERATPIQTAAVTSLSIVIHKGNGRFEITEKASPIVSGMIRTLRDPVKEKLSTDYLPEINDEEVLAKKDFYKELRLRGYNYQGLFRGVETCSITGKKAHLSWSKNWATFMDTMLQVQILSCPFRELVVPTSVRKVVIDVEKHQNVIQSLTEENNQVPVFAYKEFDAIVSGGIEIHGVQTSQINRRRQPVTPVIEEYQFVAYRDKAEVSLNKMAQLCIDLCTEIDQAKTLKTVELVEDDDLTVEQLVTPFFMKKADDLPLTTSVSFIATAPERFPQNTFSSNITVIDPKNLPTDGSIHIAAGQELFSKRRMKSVLRLLSALNNTGFLFTQETIVNDETLDNLDKLGLNIIFEKQATLDKRTFLLLRKRQKLLLENTDVVQIDGEKFDWIEKLKVHMENKEKNTTNKKEIILVSHDPESGIIGFANCVRKELNGEGIKCVLVSDKDAPKFSLEKPFYAKQLELNLPMNVLRGNVWGSYRHVQLPPQKPKPYYQLIARQKTRGDLTSFQWKEGPLREDESKGNRVIRVAYASLNFKDVMLATGKLSLNTIQRSVDVPDVQIGLEFSGLNSKGDRVMGILHKESAIANLNELEELFQFDVPDEWTLQQAATVPCVYVTTICALYTRGNMKKGDKVLIHSGSGGIGQAAIYLALAEGCEVFTTVGTPEKREFIKKTYPSIKDDHIGNSRDTSFEQMIMKMTNGQGVDIVLNSLAEEKLHASMRCLARGGRFLEIGKYDISMNSEIGMYAFLKEITFHSIMLDALVFYGGEKAIELRGIMIEMLRRRAIKPIVSTCFSADEIEDAFRYMAAGKHIGKVLIKLRNENGTIYKPMLGYPCYYCRRNRSYVLIGGFGGLGLELSHWLYVRGARNIVFVTRNGIVTGYQRMRIEMLKASGVNVKIISGLDASERNDCKEILQSARKLAPVDGIFNLAACLRDSLFINQTVEDFIETVKPKAWITKRLDEVSRILCPELRQFVVFSSVSCGKGNPGQSNYGYANSVMERICEKRRKDGLPGLAIQWGAIGEVGLVAEKHEIAEEFSISGTLQQRLASCFEELDRFLSQDRPVVSSMVVAEKSKSSSEASNVIEAVMHIMGVKDIKNVSHQTTLAELGLDSMLAVEIKQTLERDFDMILSLQEIRNLNLAKLIESSLETEEEAGQTADKNDRKSELFVDIQGMLDLLSSDLSNSKDCVDVPSLATDKTTQAFLISGINSDISSFAGFWGKLRFPTRCLRLPPSIAYDTVDKVLDYLMSYVPECMKNREKFVVVAYSVGSIFGIEMVRRLEKMGFTGRLVLIDASPDFLKAVKASIPLITSDSQTNFILFIMSILDIGFTPAMISEILACPTWEQKAQTAFQYYKALSPEADFEIFMRMAIIFYKRLQFVDAYDASSLAPIESPIVLLKPSELIVHQLESDYGLSKVTRGNVDVYVLQGNHRTIVQDEKIALIINDTVESKKQGLEQRGSTQPPITQSRART